MVNRQTENNVLVDDELKRQWDASPELRSEFLDRFSCFAAFQHAKRRGAVRILNPGTRQGEVAGSFR